MSGHNSDKRSGNRTSVSHNTILGVGYNVRLVTGGIVTASGYLRQRSTFFWCQFTRRDDGLQPSALLGHLGALP